MAERETSYAVENALFQWEEGEKRVRDAPDLERPDLERGVAEVLDALRRRLGSTFLLEELADFYGTGTDWAADVPGARAAGTDSPWVVDAAFNRYAREAANFAGGRTRLPNRD